MSKLIMNLKNHWFPTIEDWPVYDRIPPLVIVPAADACRVEAELACMRHKSWASSTRASSRADAIGLLGELVFHRFMGSSTLAAAEDFSRGLAGDNGVDYYLGDMRIDVKTTASSNGTLQFAFTTSNRNAEKANAVAFVHLIEAQNKDIHGHLLGWSWKYQITPYLRPSEKFPNLKTVRLDTLKRNNVLYSASQLNTNETKIGEITCV